MSVRKILPEGHLTLRKKSLPIKKFDATLRALVDDMWETMYAANGVGLAAPQIGLGLRLIVIDVPMELEENKLPGLKVVMVNPELVQLLGEQNGDEGCLSVPGYYASIPRKAKAVMEGYDLDGKKFRVSAEGYAARACQHEVDHLDGRLFLDRLTDALTIHYSKPTHRPDLRPKEKTT